MLEHIVFVKELFVTLEHIGFVKELVVSFINFSSYFLGFFLVIKVYKPGVTT